MNTREALRWSTYVALLLLVGWGFLHFGFPAASSVAGPNPDRWFAMAYDVAPWEVVRCVPPPYVEGRGTRFARGWARQTAPPGVRGYMGFHAGQTDRFAMMSSAPCTLGGAVTFCGSLTEAELEISPELRELPIDGDWTVRKDAPRDARLKAVESIARRRLNRPIVIERKVVTDTVIAVRGEYRFVPLPFGRRPQTVQLYTDGLDPAEGAGGGSGSLESLFSRIENITGRRVVNRIGTPERRYAPGTQLSWSNNSSARNLRGQPEKIAVLLRNIEKQTSLTLTLEPGEVERYVVREDHPW